MSLHRWVVGFISLVLGGVLSLAQGLPFPDQPAVTAVVASAQEPEAAAGVLLVGLRTGVAVRSTAAGLRPVAASLVTALDELNVQRLDRVFPSPPAAGGRSAVAAEATPLDRIFRLRFDAATDLEQAVRTLQAHPDVDFVEPDYVAHPLVTPNDPNYSSQWALAKINAAAAWDVGTGSNTVAIATVDSGVLATHADLINRFWVNPGEIAGNSLDDDNNGYVDDINGWNLPGNTANVSDSTGHGTQVAGIIGAATNNSVGVAGVCWNCRLMIVKVTQAGGIANYSDIAAGVVYAAHKGAKVINISLGGSADSATLRAAIALATQAAVVVAGAGNDDSAARFYPAAYDGVLAVAGTSTTDTKTNTSNYGDWVDVAAPAEATTTLSDGTYGTASGTSIAGPFASGLAGLLAGLHPTWPASLIRAQILQTADSISAANPAYAGKLGSGRINAGLAMTTTPTTLLRFVSHSANQVTGGAIKAGADVAIRVTLRNDWLGASLVTATLSTTDPVVTISKSTASWGAVASGATVTNSADPFQVSVPAGTFGRTIPFTLSVVADGIASSVSFSATTESATLTVGGTLVGDTLWTSDRSYVADNVIVPSGVTLTIQPGTTIKFNKGRALVVRGTLIADGTAEQPIRFTSAAAAPAPGDWGGVIAGVPGGIIFTFTSQSATFDGTGAYLSGSIVRHSIIEYSAGIGLASGPFLSSNLITKNGGESLTNIPAPYAVFHARHAAGAPLAIISKNRIVENTAVVVSGSPVPSIVLDGNLIAGNSGGVLWGNATLRNNTITGNGTVGCDSKRSVICGQATTGVIVGNNIYGNGGEIDVMWGTTTVDAANNYWGTADLSAIRARIWDQQQDLNLGTINVTPFLIEPSQTAPSFLHQLSTSPGSPIGIQRVTFNLNFSAPMDQSVDPSVTFSSTARDTWTNYTTSNSGLPSTSVYSVAIDRDGSKWFGTGEAVAHLQGTTWKTYTPANSGLESSGTISAIAVDPTNGTKWFAGFNRVSQFNGTAWASYSCGPATIPCHRGAPDDPVTKALAIDATGTKWFATANDGLVSFDGTTWSRYSTANSGIPSNRTTSIAIDLNGAKWIATDSGVARLSGGNWSVFNTDNSGLPSNTVRAVAVDGSGIKWFATREGLTRFDGTAWSVHPLAGAPGVDVTTLAIDSRGAKWLTIGGSLTRFDDSGWQTYMTPVPYTGAALAIDKDDTKWLIAANMSVHALYSGLDFSVVENSQWTSDRTWKATCDITSLVSRGTYAVKVVGAKGVDGMEIPTDTRFKLTVDYAGEITDRTAPQQVSVSAAGRVSDASAVTARWTASDPESAIVEYRYVIGSSPGTADIVSWTHTSSAELVRTGLGLVAGRQYWLSLQARNAAGLWSAPATAGFVAGAEPPLIAVSPTTLAFTATGGASAIQSVSSAQTVTVSFAGGTSAWTAVSSQPWLQITGGSGAAAGTFSAQVVPGSVPSGATSFTATITVSGASASNGPLVLPVTLTVTPATIAVSPALLTFGATVSAGAIQNVTSAQTVTVTFSGSASSWSAVSSHSWLQITSGSGAAAGTFSAHVVPSLVPSEATSLTATVTVSGPGVSNSPLVVPVTLTVTQSTATANPFGSFDTPAAGSTVAGSIAVTGWALDDIGIDRVELWRDLMAGETTPTAGSGLTAGKIFIATAFFVTGARPDVAAQYASYPQAERAGWGYLMLTQGLWNRGNGAVTLHAFAYDKDGRSASLGSKTLTASNATATKPFGSIDTPAYGETVSGSIWNFGWALTPNADPTCTIASSGVQVAIDSGPLMPVSYGDFRSDVAASFPGTSNVSGAGGAFWLDTTTLSNGTHQIGWFVTDNCGRAEGVGSRFFTVLNGSSTVPLAARPTTTAADAVREVIDQPIIVRRALEAVPVEAIADGHHLITIRQDERIEVELPATSGALYAGYQIANGTRRALPDGSSFDGATGRFYWQPAAGFLGTFELEFVPATGGVVRVQVTVAPEP
jgi:subtilisin family serine protease